MEKDHFPKKVMAFISGPRQVGKTYLSKVLLKEKHSSDLYKNWDDIDWRRKLAKEPYAFLDSYRPKTSAGKPLIVLDEIHKFPRWKKYVKGLWDTRGDKFDVIVTGSGRLDLYQRGGDSLLGRYHNYRLHPFSVKELLEPEITLSEHKPSNTLKNLLGVKDVASDRTIHAFKDLFKWGGFPRPLIAKNENELRIWHREKRQLLTKEDLRDISRIQLISHVEELVELLTQRSGQILSYNALREDLQVAIESVRLWSGYLEKLYYIYLVRPFAGKIARALRREPKIYLWDWSEVQNEGERFENLVASHLLKWCHFTEDWGFEPLKLHFVRDKEKREVDFLITKDKKPWILIETKLSDTDPGPSIHYFAEKLGVKHKFMVVANLRQPGMAKDVHVLDAPNFLANLPV